MLFTEKTEQYIRLAILVYTFHAVMQLFLTWISDLANYVTQIFYPAELYQQYYLIINLGIYGIVFIGLCIFGVFLLYSFFKELKKIQIEIT